ncbi:MAG: hypothetical protein H6837_05730 [Planctomycetes bacterium]|nr:hypothetical protein [Planctomycetota bacterium]
MSSSNAALRSAILATMLAGPLAVLGALSVAEDPGAIGARKPLVHREDRFAGAASCLPCHPDHHASWQRTWHATMTRRPGPATVRGAFDGRPVRFFGDFARPFVEGDRYCIDLPRRGGGRRMAEVALVVGSHRYQQYFERIPRPGRVGDGDGPARFERLPILWHVEERRWLHVDGIFLSPDHPDWHQQPAVWNENCIFCHNTAPRPGMSNFADRPQGADKDFDSKVADLGIACESCHGPGQRHVDAMRDPTVRYGLRVGGADRTLHIVQPEKLDKERAVSACGQCHGQRVPRPVERIRQFLERGPTFRSGARLEDHVEPVGPATRIGGDAPFRLRFWGDGTPRLTAYEYQGTVSSPCYLRGSMTCGSCHAMHRGSIDANLADGMDGDRACLQCHASIAADLRAHTRHDPAGSGSRCLACHMPEIVYGVLGVHRSHRIENPDPARDAATGRPDACTLCHLDRSLGWAGGAMQRLFGSRYRVPTARRDGVPIDRPDALASVLAGDAVQRAVYAHALGRGDAAPADGVDRRLALLASLGDAYASVRTLAWRSLRRLEERRPLGIGPQLAAFDPAASTDPGARRAVVAPLLRDFAARARASFPAAATRYLAAPDLQPDIEELQRLLARQSTQVISIGE